MMGKGYWRGLLAVSTFALLAGCGWFGGDAPVGKARPGADRQVAPSATLPPAHPGGRFEQGIAPVDETRGTVGSVVPAKGGQRAQKEAADKEAADRDAKEREQRGARDAADREAKAKQQSAPLQTAPIESPPAAGPATPEPAPATPKS